MHPYPCNAILQNSPSRDGVYTRLKYSKQYGTGIKIDIQINKTESRNPPSTQPQKNPCIYGQLIFYKGAKYIQREKDSLTNKWCWGKWIFTYKRMKLDILFYNTHKN